MTTPLKSVNLYEDGQTAAFEAARARLEELHDGELRDGDVLQKVCEVFVAFVAEGDEPDWAAEYSSSATSVTCRNCGASVSKKYVDVFEPEHVDRPEVCPFCPDKVRDITSDTGIREARSKRHGRTGSVT